MPSEDEERGREKNRVQRKKGERGEEGRNEWKEEGRGRERREVH